MKHLSVTLFLALPLTLAAAGEGCTPTEVPAPEADTAIAESEPGEVTPAESTAIRRAVQRSLPYLEAEGVAWMEQRKCVSCHQIPMMIWGFQAAVDRGLEVDAEKLEAWTAWTLKRSHEEDDNFDGVNHLILGRPQRDDGLEEDFLALHRFVKEQQGADGTWEAGGQLPFQRRPAAESHHVSTAWSVLALRAAGDTGEEVQRAREHLEVWWEEDGWSLEWLLVRLLLAQQEGSQDTDALLAEVLAAQNEDGGWSWLLGEVSDAFATGQTLYAMARVPASDSLTRGAAARGREYLLTTQTEDGTWPTRSTLKREEGIIPTSTYWGTGWAVVGLLEALPRAEPARAEVPRVAVY